MLDRTRLLFPLFPLGQCVATPGALAALEEANQSPADFLIRHVHGDWGGAPMYPSLLCNMGKLGKP